MRTHITLVAAAFFCVVTGVAQPLPVASRPEDVGFSSQRLDRVKQMLKADVDAGHVPGAVLLLARNGKIALLHATGVQDRKTQKPMRNDAIFRIASMTKPITTVAAMILAERGKLDIGAPVDQYLPEFRDVRVGVEKVPPKRPMTVQDLMRHTSGLTYGLFGDSAVDKLYQNSNMFASKSLKEMVATIASLPLLHQPGEFWEYSVSTDVLGRVVEVVSGMDLDRFIAQEITTPLKMPDTAFYVNAGALDRVAKPDSAVFMPDDSLSTRPALLSGGGGMLSTASDYGRFCQMLLNGGEFDGVRLLSRKTVELMTSDQLPPTTERHTPVAAMIHAFGPVPEMGTSFGLGFGVRVDAGRNPVPGSVGDFSWAGITGTYFWVDPKEKLIAVLMVQLPRADIVPFWRHTRAIVYQALN